MRVLQILGTLIVLGAALFGVSWITSRGSLPKQDPFQQASAARDPEEGELPPPPPDPEDSALKKEGDTVPEVKEYAVVNPFNLTAPGPHPRVEANETELNFGVMTVLETKSHEFVVRNTGQAPLKLAKGHSTCKCTIPSVGDEATPPGGETRVVLEWHPIQLDPQFRQEAEIWTNDPENPKLVFTIEGVVMPEAMILPESGFPNVQMYQGESATVTGLIMSRERTDIEISRSEGSDGVEIAIEPVDDQTLAEHEAVMGFAVRITLKPGEKVAAFKEHVTLHTNLKTAPTIVWTIQAQRLGPLQIVGANWIAGRQLVNLGQFRASEGKELRLSLFIKKSDQPLQILGQNPEGPVKAALTRNDAFQVENREQYFLTFKFPPGETPGKRADEDPLVLEIGLNHPSVSTLLIGTTYEAY